MKRLEAFLYLMRSKGFNCICNWETQAGPGLISSYRITHKDGWMLVIFQTFGMDDGFTHYIESAETNMDKCVEEITKILKG